MFGFGRRGLLVGVVVVGGVVAGPAFGDVSGSGFVPVTGDDVLLRQARESLFGESGAGPSGSAVNPSEFTELSDAEALSLARREFAADLGGSLWSPPVLPGGSRIAGYASDSTAVVDGPGGRTLLTSLLPLRSPDGPRGVKAPVSTSLEARTGGYEPANPLTPVVIPGDLGDGVGLGRVGVGVTPIGVDSAEGTRLGSDKVFFANAAVDTDVVVGALPDGVETFTQIRSADSLTEQGLKLDLPAGASLERAPDGFGEVVKRDGVVIARVSPASAIDAEGNDVPVSESVHGDTVSIHVDDTESGVRYPILLDPTVTVDSRYWDTGTSSTSLTGWEYRTTNINAFSSSTSGAWGRGLYSLVRAGLISGTDAGEWRYAAPGDARIVGFGLGQVGKPAMRIPNSANGYVPICTSQGLRIAGTSRAWEPGSNWQSGTSTGNGPRTVCQGPSTSETPTFCASSGCADTGGSPGNAAINNQWAYGTGTRLRYNNDPYGVSEYDFIGAAYVSIADDKPPSVGVLSHSNAIPAGPVNHFTDTVTLGANDTGTGIWHLALKGPADGGTGPGTANQDQGYYCDGSRTVPCAASWNNSSPWPAQQAFTYNTDNLPEGPNTFTATARDRVGNTAEAPHTQAWTIIIDRTPPDAATLDATATSPTNQTTESIRFTGESEATFTCSTDEHAYTPCASPVTLSDLADGTHSLSVRQTDRAGNTGPAASTTWMVDKTPPNVTLGGSLSDGHDSDPTDPVPELFITADDPTVNGSASGVASAELFVDGAAANTQEQQELQRIETDQCTDAECRFVGAVAPSTDGGDAPDADTVSLDTSTLTPGAHQLKLVVTDKAGNRRQSDWVHTFNPTAVGLPPEDQADDPGSSEDGVSDSGHGCQLQPAPAPLDLASSLGALPDQPPTNSTAAANDFTALNAMAADAGIVIDEDAHPTVALTDEGRALTAINQAVASGEAAPVEASAGPEATIAVGVGLSQTCISTPQMQAASSFAKLAPDSALLALGSTGAVAVQSVQDSVNLAYWVPASIAAAGLQIKLDLHDGQSLVQDGDNVAVKANPDLNADMEQLDEGQLPPDSGAPVPPDSPDPAAMGDDSPGQDPGTYTSDTPEGGLTLGEEDAYLRPVSATVNGQPVRLTLTVTGPDTIIAAVAQSHATGQVQMKISAHAAKGRPPRPEQPPQWNGKTSPCGRSNPCGGGLNIAKALAYTRKYVNSNNRYYTINDAYDCTNFISQILWAGGMRLRRAYTSGADSWWFWRAKKGWVKREEHTKSWVRFDSLRDQLLHLGLGRRVPIDKVQPGDLVFYDFGGGDGHAVIVTETKDGNAKFCYHSTNICRWRRPFKGDTSAERERRFEVIQAYDHRVAIRIRAVQANIHQEH